MFDLASVSSICSCIYLTEFPTSWHCIILFKQKRIYGPWDKPWTADKQHYRASKCQFRRSWLWRDLKWLKIAHNRITIMEESQVERAIWLKDTGVFKDRENDQCSSRHSSQVTSKAISNLQSKLKQIPPMRHRGTVQLFAPVNQWEKSMSKIEDLDF